MFIIIYCTATICTSVVTIKINVNTHDSFARKTTRDNYETEELKILRFKSKLNKD